MHHVLVGVRRIVLCLIAILLALPSPVRAYAVLSHEAIIDAVWETHVKTEFGFDVLEIARERYAPDSYHDFVGFEVSRPVLDQAFRETYGLELKDVLVNEEKVLSSYRRDVSKLVPKATRIAWHLKKDEIKDDIPDATKRKFLFNLSGANYEREWGKDYRRTSHGERFLAYLYKLIPTFSPLT